MAEPVALTRAEARRFLVSHLGLDRIAGKGRRGVRKVLDRLRCIQLDPLDPIGTNADLVAMARVDGIGRGDVMRYLFPGYAFEHFAKERCLLPADSFPWYREQGHAAQAPWWRHDQREARVPREVVDRVLDEVRDRGPVTAADLTDHGAVVPLDWSGWKGTARATSMALEILWTRCDVVVAGRTESGAKLYDTPERALGEVALAPVPEPFERWAVRERVRAAGLLSRAGGSHWSMLGQVRTSGIPDAMIDAGELVEVKIEGSSRAYLAVPEILDRRRVRYDGRVRILGPLDPLIWDRHLVRQVFDFDYAWEVYKPPDQRRWGWYVCPLLHRDRLVGRVDARIENGTLRVRRLWRETDVDPSLIREALQRHAGACGVALRYRPRGDVDM